MLILDTLVEVFVWVGQSVDTQQEQKAVEIGRAYIKLASECDGLSADVALHIVTEGNEQSNFTTCFTWDFAKAKACFICCEFRSLWFSDTILSKIEPLNQEIIRLCSLAYANNRTLK